jgi:acetylornithine deacetylase/succinyl-diaminopimelate desuccinylase-like protein
VIPDRVEIDLDCRTLPGETAETVFAHVRRALGDELADRVEISPVGIWPSTASPAGTPMWDAMTAAAQAHYPDATLLPGMIVGFTDARFFRERGAVAYGAGLVSANLSAADFSARFHGHNERIDVESLRLTTDFFLKVLDRLGA